MKSNNNFYLILVEFLAENNKFEGALLLYDELIRLFPDDR